MAPKRHDVIDSLSDGNDTPPLTDNDTYSSEEEVTVRWSKEDTDGLQKHFADIVFSRDEENKGNLPSKSKILEYLNKERPESVEFFTTSSIGKQEQTYIMNVNLCSSGYQKI